MYELLASLTNAVFEKLAPINSNKGNLKFALFFLPVLLMVNFLDSSMVWV